MEDVDWLLNLAGCKDEMVLRLTPGKDTWASRVYPPNINKGFTLSLMIVGGDEELPDSEDECKYNEKPWFFQVAPVDFEEETW